jgi:predicted TPR repeat methyltransferase
MVEFNEEQRKKYSLSKISGTGYLAYRDVQKFSLFHEVNFSKGLCLGCGIGRSTKFLSNFCNHVSGIDVSKEMLDMAENSLTGYKFYLNNDKEENGSMTSF